MAWRARREQEGSSGAASGEPSPWKREDVKSALIAESHGKCVYCESKLRHVTFGDVEHRRPKSQFPNEVLAWVNLGLACAVCNNAKSDQWSENSPIVWPFVDDPSEHVTFVRAFVSGRTARGKTTVAHTLLDRLELFEQRQRVVDDVVLQLDGVRRIADTRHRAIQWRAVKDSRSPSDQYFACFSTYLATRSGEFEPTVGS